MYVFKSKPKMFSFFIVCFVLLLETQCLLGQYVAPTISQRKEPVIGTATSWIHVEELDGVWWFVDPDGNAFFDVAVCLVGTHADAKLIQP